MAKKINIQEFFNDNFGTIRTITKDNKIWFVGNDIAEILGYKSPKQAIIDHVKEKHKMMVKIKDLSEMIEGSVSLPSKNSDKHGKGKHKKMFKVQDLSETTWGGETPPHKKSGKGGLRQLMFIDESGVYKLISHSKLPSAEEFQDWLYEEVLPSIRQDGFYEDEHWMLMRSIGKEDRLDLNASVAIFEEYCEGKFYISARKYTVSGTNLYSTISMMINSSLNLPTRNKRDEFSKKKLAMIDTVENKVSNVIIRDITRDKHPDKIFKHIKNAIKKIRKKFIENGMLKDTLLVDLFRFKNEDDTDLEE